MHATDARDFADLANLRMRKDRVLEAMNNQNAMVPGVVEYCIVYHREIARRMEHVDDREILSKYLAALGKDMAQLNRLREAMMQRAAQERDPVSIEKLQMLLAALERLMTNLHRILEEHRAQQWTYLDRRRNPAMPSTTKAPDEKPESAKQESASQKKKKP
jgi:hypothetical protein